MENREKSQLKKELKILEFNINMETLKRDKIIPVYEHLLIEWEDVSKFTVYEFLISKLSVLPGFDREKFEIKIYENENFKAYYANTCLMSVSNYAKLENILITSHRIEINRQHRFEDLQDSDILFFEVLIMLLKLYQDGLFTLLSSVAKHYNIVGNKLREIAKINSIIGNLKNEKNKKEFMLNNILLRERLIHQGGEFNFMHTVFSLGNVNTKTIFFYKEEGGFVYYFTNNHQKEQFDKNAVNYEIYLSKSQKNKFYIELNSCIERDKKCINDYNMFKENENLTQ